MPINLDEALGAELEPAEFSWTSSDIQLYHLGLGAGSDPMDERELRYLVDDTPQVMPTFGNVAQSFHMTEPPSVQFPGIDIELSRVLHASEAVTVPAPMPPSGTGRAVTRFTDIWDKGTAAVIWSETTVAAPDGAPLWTQKRSIFARCEGGFGGERGPSTPAAAPDRAPDLEVDMPVLPQQADIVLGLHRIEDPTTWDMVDTEVDGRVRSIVMKPPTTALTYGWDFAVWTPVFSEFLHRFLQSDETKRDLGRLASTANDPGGDLAVGVVLQAALKAGLSMQSIRVHGAGALDIGTPENLAHAVRLHHS